MCVFVKYPYIAVLIEMAAPDEPFAAAGNGSKIFERNIFFMLWQMHQSSKANTHAPAANEDEDSGIVAIPHLSRDLLACYDGNGSNFGTHPQNVLRGMIYDTKTWEYPYLYNLIDQYRSLSKYNNG